MTLSDECNRITVSNNWQEVKFVMDQAREIINTIMNFIESYIQLIKNFVAKLKNLGKEDETTGE